MYSINTGQVMVYLGFVPFLDFNVESDNGVISVEWLSLSPQPTEQEIATAEASQAYLDWYAENGGDPVKTLRKQAETNLSEGDRSNVLLRSVILTMVDEFNRHSDRTNALLTAIGSATSLTSLQTEAALIDAIPARTGAQLRTAAITKINTGDADN